MASLPKSNAKIPVRPALALRSSVMRGAHCNGGALKKQRPRYVPLAGLIRQKCKKDAGELDARARIEELSAYWIMKGREWRAEE